MDDWKPLIAIFKYIFKWIAKSAVGKAVIGTLVKVAFYVFFIMAIAASGILPRSPLRLLVGPLTQIMGNIPYTRYIAAFIPIQEIMLVLPVWVIAMFSFHTIKVILRRANIIK